MLKQDNPIIYQQKLFHQEDKKLAQFGMLFFSALIMVFLYSDYVLFEFTSRFFELLWVRSAALIVSFVAYAFITLSEKQKHQACIIFLWLMLYLTMVLYISTTRPLGYIANIAIDSSIILSIFILFRNKLLFQIIPGLYFSIALMLELFLFKSIETEITYFVIVIDVISVNIAGIFISHTITHYRKLELSYLENEYEMKCQLKKMAFSDDLTSLQNRRSVLDTFQAEFERIRRYRKPLSIMILDIDDFKMINDQYGHENGDIALKSLANNLNLRKRTTDHLGRIGGEEFIMLLPETGVREAENVAGRILEVLNSRRIDLNGSKIKMTVSIGLTVVRNDDATIQECIRRADRYLYKAKRRGKNNVYSDSDVEAPETM